MLKTASKHPEAPILIVDDEEETLRGVSRVFRSGGIDHIQLENDSRKVMPWLEENPTSLIFLDLSMPHMTGEDLLPRIRDEFSHIPVVIFSGGNDLETAVWCMRQGAFDYLLKPVEKSRLLTCAQRALQIRELEEVNLRLKSRILDERLEEPEAFDAIVTSSKKMQGIFRYVEAIAGTQQPVLVTGETGVGKELMARSIHQASGVKGHFVPINVAGLDDQIFSDTLFGHKKGAFTGATENRKGLIETAAGGTLFLDEIGDLKMSSQVKLLRLLQEREYYPLGSDMPKRAEARIVVATNQDLAKLIKEGNFRKDLYYRLQTHHIHLPALRERIEDLPVLLDYFLEAAAEELGKKKPTPPKQIYPLLKTYSFPGNIRELESIVFDAVSKHTGRVLSLEVFKNRVFGDTEGFGETPRSLELLEGDERLIQFGETLPSLKEIAYLLIDEAMERAGHNQSIASRMLGITQQALSKRLKSINRPGE